MITGTLIVQIINFCIAYFLLRWLYFKPAIAQIQQEEKANADFNNSIVERCLIIEQKRQFQKEHWRACKEYCQQQMPSIPEPDFVVLKDSTFSLEPLMYNDATLKKLSDEVTNTLVQRIDHVS